MNHPSLTKEAIDNDGPGMIIAAHEAGLLDHLFTNVQYDEHRDWFVCDVADIPTWVSNHDLE